MEPMGAPVAALVVLLEGVLRRWVGRMVRFRSGDGVVRGSGRSHERWAACEIKSSGHYCKSSSNEDMSSAPSEEDQRLSEIKEQTRNRHGSEGRLRNKAQSLASGKRAGLGEIGRQHGEGNRRGNCQDRDLMAMDGARGGRAM